MIQDRRWFCVLLYFLYFRLLLDGPGNNRLDVVIYNFSVWRNDIRPHLRQRPYRTESKAVAGNFGSFAECMAEAIGRVVAELIWVGYS